VKLIALTIIKSIFIKIQEKYMTAPYVMELLEDQDEKVSNEVAESIRTIEYDCKQYQ
jgi:hypothetical protein